MTVKLQEEENPEGVLRFLRRPRGAGHSSRVSKADCGCQVCNPQSRGPNVRLLNCVSHARLRTIGLRGSPRDVLPSEAGEVSLGM